MAQAREADTYVVDCDAHVLEPPDLWERYLENKYKDRAIKIVTEEDGRESLVIDNGPHALTGRLAVLGGVLLERSKLWTPETEYVKYLDGAPRPSMYGPDRLKLFDASGIDAGIVAPTIGLVWETDDVGLLYGWLLNWNDICDTEVDAVVEDEECGVLCAEMMSKKSS